MKSLTHSNNKHKTALVLGFTGGVGFEVAKALLADSYHVTALIRDPTQKTKFSHPNLIYQIGNAQDETLINRLTQNKDVVLYGINYNYVDWATLGVQTLEITAQACIKSGSRLLFPGNIYGFAGTDESTTINENTSIKPTFELGEIRINMENRLEVLHKQFGLKYLIFRAGNYIGEFAPSTWLAFLIKQNEKNKQVSLTTLGDINKTISWNYLPDLAYNLVQILNSKAEDLNDNEVFCFEGLRYSFTDIKNTLQKMTKQKVKQKKLSFVMISILSIFMRKLRKTSSTRSLFEKTLLIDQTKLIKVLAKQNIKVKQTNIEQVFIGAGLIRI
ncbi:MAG: NAD-dependent epimerase/dehydratase family protein [Saccharospirillaceae bacterium]|nr:NAD-dependent epimerase/dehydratase family protein [Pseudomonadales bacterium]NRB78113.1 NAD-dependent epimerase/dehydratase family protein [Saccharospirillaceae bacterium]